jgi:hypothetical protein
LYESTGRTDQMIIGHSLAGGVVPGSLVRFLPPVPGWFAGGLWPWHGAGHSRAQQRCACHEREVGMSTAAFLSLLEEGTLLGDRDRG